MVLSFAFLSANDWCVSLEVAAGGSPPFWVTPPVTAQAELAWLPFWCFVADSCLLRTHRSLLLIPDSCSGPLQTDPNPGSALPLLVSSILPWLYALAVICVLGYTLPLRNLHLMLVLIWSDVMCTMSFSINFPMVRLLVGWVMRLLPDTVWRSGSRPLFVICTSKGGETVLGQVARGFPEVWEGWHSWVWVLMERTYTAEKTWKQNLIPRSE